MCTGSATSAGPEGCSSDSRRNSTERKGSRAALPSPEFLGDFPHIARRTGEGGGPAAPRAVDRAVEQCNAFGGEIGAGGIAAFDLDGQQHARTGLRGSDRYRGDEFGCGGYL